MSEKGSVTKLLEPLRRGDSSAAEAIWRRYFRRMTAAARAELVNEDTAVADEEDAAISALQTFYMRFQDGRIRQVANRNDLWAMLVVLTRRKVTRQRRHDRRLKRGGGLRRIRVGRVSDDSLASLGWSRIEDTRWTPALRGGLDARCEELLELLGDESLQRVALRRLEGYSNQEIATELKVAVRSVERKLNRIRAIWEQERIR